MKSGVPSSKASRNVLFRFAEISISGSSCGDMATAFKVSGSYFPLVIDYATLVLISVFISMERPCVYLGFLGLRSQA